MRLPMSLVRCHLLQSPPKNVMGFPRLFPGFPLHKLRPPWLLGLKHLLAGCFPGWVLGRAAPVLQLPSFERLQGSGARKEA